jgi:hypothetical protein
MGVKKQCRERGKNFIFRRGGGINIVLGPKYRPPIICEVLIGISVLKEPTPNATVFLLCG